MTAPQQARLPPFSKANPPPAASPNSTQSPKSSRDSSPAPFVPSGSTNTAASAGSRGMRSRKNSHEVSPVRQSSGASTVPSAAAIQRALSGAGVPQLQPTTTADSSSRIPRSQRSNGDVAKESPS